MTNWQTNKKESSLISNAFLKLFLCGASALFWELVLIRWFSSCIRIVAYYSNFVLISAFLGLGAGALLTRYKFRLWKIIFIVLAVCVFMGPFLGSFYHLNPNSPDEFIWIGSPRTIIPSNFSGDFLGLNINFRLPYQVILGSVYIANALLFLIFGQWLGHLFQNFRPLKAYSIEIAGSVFGILLFTCISVLHLSPTIWFLIGFVLIILIIDMNVHSYLLGIACSVMVFLACANFNRQFIWSPYYKIALSTLEQSIDLKQNLIVKFDGPVGYVLSVNNDYHQMMLDLHPRDKEHTFLKSWRRMYDYPYSSNQEEPEGAILIVGAGTGNDVSAALRNGQLDIDAIEIDPSIIDLGKLYHPEQLYHNSQVNVIVDDARSFFVKTDKRYAKIVFGFLDSHTLMSSFSSVRLDNFVYTSESMQQVKKLLLPGGKVYLTFASNTKWLHQRMIKLLDSVFDYPTKFVFDKTGYANGIVYINGKKPVADISPVKKASIHQNHIKIPTDNWPFLYMKAPVLPNHYKVFIGMVVLLGACSLLLLPPGQRKIRFPYFFMGAGFFLVETSNVVSLSLLYGSTWLVNVTVFTGILILIFLGNLICALTSKPRFNLMFFLIFTSLAISYIIPPSFLLRIDSVILQGLLAILVFLSPIFFASLIFGHLIKQEKELYQAYGSNLLGAIIGGACEYFSLVAGIKFLLIITFLFYAMALIFLKTGSKQIA